MTRARHETDPADDPRRRTLRDRARALARPPDPDVDPRGRLSLVEFALAGERYAVEGRWVREVHPLRDLTPIPCTPAFVLGMVNVRGRIVSVVDVRRLFDLPIKGLTDLNQVIILRAERTELGILADAIVGMRSVAADEVQTALPTLTGRRAEFLRGVTADGLVVLDAGSVLTSPALVVNEEVEG